LPNGKDML